MMKKGIYPSPDRRYYVEVYGGYSYPGETGIGLFSGRPGRQPHPPHADLLGHIDPGPVSGLAWLPGRQHTLIFGSRGDPGYSMLGLWNGGRDVRMLHKVNDAQVDLFKLFAVSRDGKRIIYGWNGDSDGMAEPKRLRKRYLRLPVK